MKHEELGRHLACIEDHLMRWGWDAWDFELTNTTHLYAPWSNPPVTEVQPDDRVIAQYTLKSRTRHPVAFCLAELESDRPDEIAGQEDFLKILAHFHATLQQLPVAMYTHRGWVWDYVNIAADGDWHEDDPHESVPLNPQFIDDLPKHSTAGGGESIILRTR